MYAPYFTSDRVGENRFKAVHKIFGTSKFSKLLLHTQPDKRQEAVYTICFEAEERFLDLVYGDLPKIQLMEQELQQQFHALQREAQLVKRRHLNSQLRRQQRRQQMGIRGAGMQLSAFASNISTNGSKSSLSNLGSFSNMSSLMSNMGSYGCARMTNETQLHPHSFNATTYVNGLSVLTSRPVEVGVSSAFANNSTDAGSMNSLGNMQGSLSYRSLLMGNMGSTSYGSSRMTDETQVYPHPFVAMAYNNRLSMITSRPVERVQSLPASSPAEKSHFPFKMQNSVHDGLPLNYSIPHM